MEADVKDPIDEEPALQTRSAYHGLREKVINETVGKRLIYLEKALSQHRKNLRPKP